MVEIKVPDIGDFDEVEVVEVMVKAGDIIRRDQSLVTVESDKASMEIPSNHDGLVKELKVKIGDKIKEGTLLLTLEETEDKTTNAIVSKEVSPPFAAATVVSAAPAATSVTAPLPAAAESLAVTPVSAPPSVAEQEITANVENPVVENPHASPSVRKFARELGANLQLIHGSGPKGRILREDILTFVKAALSGAINARRGNNDLHLLSWPSLDFSHYGPTELEALSRIKKISGPNLHRNWVMIPHVTQYDEADVTELEAFRKASNEKSLSNGIRLTMLAFVIKACVAALKEYPIFNSSLDEKGENLILKRYYHIGFAADTVHGLVVPVIKNADTKGVLEIAKEMGDLSNLARDGKLNPSDMQGASFTITSLGGIGGTYFTPLINAPEVAIFGLSRLTMKPTWDGKKFVPRLILPLSLSYDHRVIDGAQGTRFTTYLAEVLGDMRKTLL